MPNLPLRSDPDCEQHHALVAHALRLSEAPGDDRPRRDRRSRREPLEQVVDLLLARFTTIDEAALRSVARQVIDEAPEPLDSLGVLAERLVEYDAGLPTATQGDLPNRLRQLVDVDPLVCWLLADPGRRAGLRDPRRHLCWPPSLPPERHRFDPLLRREMAETHCHLGSTMSSGLLWVHLLLQTVRSTALLPEKPDPERFIKEWGPLLLEAGEHACRVADSLDGRDKGLSESTKARRCRPAPPGRLLEVFAGPLRQDERPAARGDAPPDPGQAVGLDWPFGRWTLAERTSVSTLAGERLLLWRAFTRLRRSSVARRTVGICCDGDDAGLAEHLLAYLRLRNRFHRAQVHTNARAGLLAFQRVFDARADYFAPAIGKSQVQQATLEELEYRRTRYALELFVDDAIGRAGLERGASMPPLDLELRVTPRLGWRMARCLRGWLRGVRDFLLDGGDLPLRVGFVFHFLRSPRSTWLDDCLYQLEGLAALLEEYPALRLLVVGLDVAGAEQVRPPRSYVCLFQDTLDRIRDQEPDRGRWDPGLTVHVGEDPADLLTGLRHVDEAAGLLGLRPNDRLGHALAVGWDVEAYYARGTMLTPPVPRRCDAGTAVLDLLWTVMLARTGQLDVALEPSPEERLRDLLARLDAEDPAGDDAMRRRERSGGIDAAVEMMRRHYRLGVVPADSEEELLACLDLPKGLGNLDVSCDRSRIELVAAAQRAVHRRLYRAGLVIETNPTSNVQIGRFPSYASLPLIRMTRAPGQDPGEPLPRLRATINTDNPALMGTTLRSEFLRVGGAMMAEEVDADAQAIAEWLERCRSNGVESSFLPLELPRGAALGALIDELVDGFDAT